MSYPLLWTGDWQVSWRKRKTLRIDPAGTWIQKILGPNPALAGSWDISQLPVYIHVTLGWCHIIQSSSYSKTLTWTLIIWLLRATFFMGAVNINHVCCTNLCFFSSWQQHKTTQQVHVGINTEFQILMTLSLQFQLRAMLVYTTKVTWSTSIPL